ncbi:unnamed protein product [Closterium sp. NIES-54]
MPITSGSPSRASSMVQRQGAMAAEDTSSYDLSSRRSLPGARAPPTNRDSPSWLLRAERYLQSQRKDNDTLWANASGDLPSPPPPAALPTEPSDEDLERFDKARSALSVWQFRDAAACIALGSLLPESEEAHVTQGCSVPQLSTFTGSLASTASPAFNETAVVSITGGKSRGKGCKKGGKRGGGGDGGGGGGGTGGTSASGGGGTGGGSRPAGPTGGGAGAAAWYTAQQRQQSQQQLEPSWFNPHGRCPVAVEPPCLGCQSQHPPPAKRPPWQGAAEKRAGSGMALARVPTIAIGAGVDGCWRRPATPFPPSSPSQRPPPHARRARTGGEAQGGRTRAQRRRGSSTRADE